MTPRRMAELYNDYMSALWLGDDVSAMTAWLEAHWSYQGPLEPDDAPAAVSVLGGAAIGENRIRWYQDGETICGYQSGRSRGCYRIAVTESPPMIGT